jgi:hypothetical protein
MNEIRNDTSNYATEQRIAVSVWTYEQPQAGKEMDEVRELFRQIFGKETFPNKTILQLEQKYFATGNTNYNPRKRSSSKDRWQSELVYEFLANSPVNNT